jgi:hypothetical protein
MLASARGELKTRSKPNFVESPLVAVNTPPLLSATSSPKTKIFLLNSISSCSAWLIASTITTGFPEGIDFSYSKFSFNPLSSKTNLAALSAVGSFS